METPPPNRQVQSKHSGVVYSLANSPADFGEDLNQFKREPDKLWRPSKSYERWEAENYSPRRKFLE